MKHKKFLTILLSLCVGSSIPAAFAEGIELNSVHVSNFVGNTLTISGKSPVSESKVYIQIVRKDAKLNSEKEIYFTRTVKTGTDGVFSTECDMPLNDRNTGEDIDGYFTLYVGASGYDKKSVDFIFLTEKSRINFFKSLNDAGDYNIFAGVFSNTENELELKAYGVAYQKYNALSDTLKQKVFNIVKDFEYDKDNISDLNEIILAMSLNEIQDKTNAKQVLEEEEIKSRYNMVYDGVTYEEADEETKDWFLDIFLEYSKNRSFSDVKQLDSLYEQSVILRYINTKHYTEIFQILEDNADILSLNGSAELNNIRLLSKDEKNDVMKNLNNLSRSIKNTDDLKSYLKTAYDNFVQNKNSSFNSGNSYITSGGGGSKGSSNALPVGGGIKTNVVVNNVDNEKREYFDDLSGCSWAEEAINSLASKKIVSGYGDGKFGPERNVTRAEFVKMLLDAFELVQDGAECSANDVSKDDWSYKYVASAYSLGITSGLGNGNFGKNNPITRQEAATFLHRTAVRAYLPIERNQRENFSDYDDIAQWARNSVDIMYEAGVINGMDGNRFVPSGFTTRAQAAKMIYELLKYIS